MPRELKNPKNENEEDNSDVSPNVLRVVLSFRRWGWTAFWTQVVLCVVSSVVLLQLFLFPRTGAISPTGLDTSPATLPGLSFAWVGVAVLGASIFWNFRYTQMAKKLRSPDRPTKSQTVFQIKIGLIINLIGMFVTLLGAFAIIGALTLRAGQGQAILPGAGSFNSVIQPLDFQIIQASFNIIFAHFVGLVASLWLLNRATDKPNRE
jgi:hypothetical protein